MENAAVNDWFELVFWVIFAGVGVFVVWNIISMLVESFRFNRNWRAAPPERPSGGTSKDDERWSLASAASSDSSGLTLSSDLSSSSDSGGSDFTSDSGGSDFSGGGGDFGGGGSSGGWND